MEAAEAPVLRRDDGGVTTLTLNRPAHYNALSAALLDALLAQLAEVGGDDRIRVVVLAGAGKAFCAGHDLKEFAAQPDPGFARRVFGRATEVMLTLQRLPQPVIARVQGVAAAAGCQLVAQCDLAVATSDARFATSGINAGIFCATPAVPLSRTVPRKIALEMLMTGGYIDAARALACGLVNRVVPPQTLDAAVAALAAALVAQPAAALAAGKRFFYDQLGRDPAEAYAAATEAMVRNRLSDEAAEGIAAFIERRRPRWPAP